MIAEIPNLRYEDMNNKNTSEFSPYKIKIVLIKSVCFVSNYNRGVSL